MLLPVFWGSQLAASSARLACENALQPKLVRELWADFDLGFQSLIVANTARLERIDGLLKTLTL